MAKKLPVGLRKYIRAQKARIRREQFSREEADAAIREFLSHIVKSGSGK